MAVYFTLFIPHLPYLLICNGHVGCFHTLVIVNNAAVNTGLHVSFQISDLVWFVPRCIPRRVIAESYNLFLVTVKYTLQQTYSEHVAVEIWFILIIEFYYHNFC